jgi:hypothetical protein
METISPISSVVVNTARGAEARHARKLVDVLPGVLSVTADPIRGQLVVRFDSTQTASAEIHELVTPLSEGSNSFLHRAWPKLVRLFATLGTF